MNEVTTSHHLTPHTLPPHTTSHLCLWCEVCSSHQRQRRSPGGGCGGGGGGRDPRTKLCSSEEKELLKELISKGIIQEVNG